MSNAPHACLVVCNQCGAALDGLFVEQVRRLRVQHGLSNEPPKLCPECVWSALDALDDANRKGTDR